MSEVNNTTEYRTRINDRASIFSGIVNDLEYHGVSDITEKALVEIADNDEAFENLLVTYGVMAFISDLRMFEV